MKSELAQYLLPAVGALVLVTGCAGAIVQPAATPIGTTAARATASASSSVGPGASMGSPLPQTPAAGDQASLAGDTWADAGAFREGRSVTHLALLTATNEVMAVGADVACGLESDASDTTELYDVAAGAWKPGPPMPTARHDPAVGPLGDGVLVTGGSNEAYVAKSSTLVYDPVSQAWSPSGLLNTARMNPGIAVMKNGRVLVAGGLLINFDNTGRALDTGEIWDPGSGAWKGTPRLGHPRLGPEAVMLEDGRVLVVGGLPAWGADDQLRSAEVYDPKSGRWEPAGQLGKTPTWIALVATSDGALAIFAPTGGAALRAEWFDPHDMAWTVAGDPGMPVGDGRAVAVTLADDRVLVVGGDEARIFQRGGNWTKARSLPDGPRNDASAVLLPDGSALLAGGWTIGIPPDETGGCQTPNPQAWRYVPGP